MAADRVGSRAKIRLVIREHGLVKALGRPDVDRMKAFGQGCTT